VTSPFDPLVALYGAVEGAPLRLTEGGLWHATPLPVLVAAIPVLVEARLLESARVLFDAGAGDGRLLAALALGLPSSLEVRLLGLERDANLAREAEGRLGTLRRRLSPSRLPRVAEGDYFSKADYAPLGIAPAELDLVFNYPDGNERRLLRFLAAHGKPELRLVVLSPDREPVLGAPPLMRTEVRPAREAVAWSLGVYAPASESQ
jgi:hypothetical protein